MIQQFFGTTASLCGRRVLAELSPGKSYLVAGEDGRKFVLKVLESDCLIRGQLQTAVRERLERVRELAHTAVANFHGVEMAEQRAYLVWDYVEGQPLATAARRGEPLSSTAALSVSRELVLKVEALHALGIVHGALHLRNVIVDDSGAIHLIDLSPLLYSDPAQDVAAVLTMIRQLGVDVQAEPSMSLREIANRLNVQRSSRMTREDGPAIESLRPRRRALAGAVGVTIVSIALAYGVWRMTREGFPPAPQPPQAQPNVMRPSEHQ